MEVFECSTSSKQLRNNEKVYIYPSYETAIKLGKMGWGCDIAGHQAHIHSQTHLHILKTILPKVYRPKQETWHAVSVLIHPKGVQGSVLRAGHSSSSTSTLTNHVFVYCALYTGAFSCWKRFSLGSLTVLPMKETLYVTS